MGKSKQAFPAASKDEVRPVTKEKSIKYNVTVTDVWAMSGIGTTDDKVNETIGLNEIMSANAMKLLLIAIAQCKNLSDDHFFTYSIKVTELASMLGISRESFYNKEKGFDNSKVLKIDTITNQVMNAKLYVNYLVDPNNPVMDKYNIFSRCRYYPRSGVVIFKLNPDITDFILNIKGEHNSFFSARLKDYLQMKSPYSILIWTFIRSKIKHDPGITQVCVINISLEVLRLMTNTRNKFLKPGDFKINVLNQAVKEINKYCGVVVSYNDMKKSRKIIGFELKVVSPYHVDKNALPEDFTDRVKFKTLSIKQSKGESLSQSEMNDMKRLSKIYQA